MAKQKLTASVARSKKVWLEILEIYFGMLKGNLSHFLRYFYLYFNIIFENFWKSGINFAPRLKNQRIVGFVEIRNDAIFSKTKPLIDIEGKMQLLRSYDNMEWSLVYQSLLFIHKNVSESSLWEQPCSRKIKRTKICDTSTVLHVATLLACIVGIQCQTLYIIFMGAIACLCLCEKTLAIAVTLTP
ncbi:hypothetical protein ACJX0J_014656 [Zea mays]